MEKPRLEKNKMTRNEGLNNDTHNPLQPSDLGAEDEENLEWVVDERDEY